MSLIIALKLGWDHHLTEMQAKNLLEELKQFKTQIEARTGWC